MSTTVSTTATAPGHRHRTGYPTSLLLLGLLAALATVTAQYGPVSAEAALAVIGCDYARGTNCTCTQCHVRNGFHAYCASTMQCLRSQADCGQCPYADQCVALSQCGNIPQPPPPPTLYHCDSECVSMDLCNEICNGDCEPCSGPIPPPPPPTTSRPQNIPYYCDGRCMSLDECDVLCDGICPPCNNSGVVAAAAVIGCDYARGTNCTCTQCHVRNGFHAYCASTMQCLRSQADCGQCPYADQCVALSQCGNIPPPPPPPTLYHCDSECVSMDLCNEICNGNCEPCSDAMVAAKKKSQVAAAAAAGFFCGGRCFTSSTLCSFVCGGKCGRC